MLRNGLPLLSVSVCRSIQGLLLPTTEGKDLLYFFFFPHNRFLSFFVLFLSLSLSLFDERL